MRLLRRRLPVRLRQNWRLVGVSLAFLGVVGLLFGSERIRPYVFSPSDLSGAAVTEDVAGTVDIFDSAAAHDLRLSFTDDDYQRMLDDYFDKGDKEYVEADLTIDGTVVPSVGIRLKGNSTLGGLARDGVAQQRNQRGGGPGGGGFPGGGQGPGGAPPEGFQGFPGGADAGGAGQRGQAGPGGGGMGGRVSLDTARPEELPWLIKFDEFVEGRRYQGHQEIAVRVGSGSTSSVMNEALALDLIALTGEPIQRYTYSTFSVNDRPAVTRLLIEHPDEQFADELDGSVLYKALSTGSFTYKGDDPTGYVNDFKQINLVGSQDLAPVIALMKWVGEASAEEFDAGLADRVDVRSFASYVALQNLLLNFDDMSGPGQNYYLRYDLATRKISVVTWDLNLTFQGQATQGPFDAGSFGGGGRGQQAPGTEGQVPAGGQGMPQFQQRGEAGGPGGGRMMGGNALKEKALESASFKAVYTEVYRDLYQRLFAGGAALRQLDVIAARLATTDPEVAATDSATLRTLVEQRTAALATHEVITG
ncbi:CotH kinase family protein [Catenuloplanes japonicus]|uniref:CotH kinase family protein n=1 Tax=Catenuloplanes japonicus TaxID=33876 RepID=UPI00052657B2|nr:CotH kinase family protein [Catenuloplanes japonicus]